MTREEIDALPRAEMARRLVGGLDASGLYNGDTDYILAAAAALRQTCAGCKHWDKGDEITFPHCRKGFDILFDGTGFCHRYEVK